MASDYDFFREKQEFRRSIEESIRQSEAAERNSVALKEAQAFVDELYKNKCRSCRESKNTVEENRLEKDRIEKDEFKLYGAGECEACGNTQENVFIPGVSPF